MHLKGGRRGSTTIALLLGMLFLALALAGCKRYVVTVDGKPYTMEEMNESPDFNDAERLDAYLGDRGEREFRTKGLPPSVEEITFEDELLVIGLDVADDPAGRKAAQTVRQWVLEWSGKWSRLEIRSTGGSVLATAAK